MIKIDKTSNCEHKTAHRSSSELAPASWLDALRKALHANSTVLWHLETQKVPELRDILQPAQTLLRRTLQRHTESASNG
jgi:hypothetical protein